jgi:hypothetical protein
VPGASSANHDPNVTVTTTVTQHVAPLTGLQQPVTNAQLVAISIDMTQNLGGSGSLTLDAQGTTMPTGLVGTATPFLIKLVDSNGFDWVNLPRAGGSDCLGKGIYDCSSPSGCAVNAACAPQWPSAFTTRDQWEQHQLLNAGTGYPSVNVFPTCNWSTAVGSTPGSDQPTNFPKCPFAEATTPVGGTPWLSGGALPTGTYTAYYALVATQYSTLGSSYQGGFTLTQVKKKTAATIAGAVDLNVILVGTTTVNASRTVKGQQNLDTLLSAVQTYYGQAGVGIKLGQITAIEWPCEAGGDAYANVGTSGLGAMFAAGASLYPTTAGKALNVFLTSTIQNDVSSLGPGVVIDGYSGAIGGPVTNGTPASGLVFATFDKMDSYNPNCPSADATCDNTVVEQAFWNMETTVTHEMGHFLGLNHPSESDGTIHDQLYDTPVCTKKSPTLNVLTINFCLNGTPPGTGDTTDQAFSVSAAPAGQHTCNRFCAPYNSMTGVYCPTIPECQFNHIMWYTSKNFMDQTEATQNGAPLGNVGKGDGNLFSPDSGVLLNYSAYVQ